MRQDWQRLQKHSAQVADQKLVASGTQLYQRWITCQEKKDTSYIKLLHWLGQYHYSKREFSEAVNWYSKALKESRQGPIPAYLLAQSMFMLGSSQMFNGEADPAISTLSQIISLAPANAGVHLSAYAYLAWLYYVKGDYNKTIELSDKGLQLVAHLKAPEKAAMLLREKANALLALRKFKEAGITIKEAITHSNTSGDHLQLSKYYLLLGDVEATLANAPATLAAYQKALKYCRGDASLEATILTNIGFFYYENEEYPKAIAYNQHALALQTNPYSRAQLFDNLGACWWKVGKFDQAISDYQRGLQSLPIGFTGKSMLDNPPPKSIRQVLRRQVLLTLILDKAETWLDYYKTSENKHHLEQALNTYKLASEMVDLMRWDHTDDQVKLFWRKKTRKLYQQAIETSYLLGDAKQAFYFFEKSKAVMLADKLNELGARQRLSESQQRAEKGIQERIGNLQKELAQQRTGQAGYQPIQQQLEREQLNLTTFRKGLENTNPAYYQYKYDNSVPTLDTLQKWLRRHSASFVSYFVDITNLYILAVTADTAQLFRKPVHQYQVALAALTPLLTKSAPTKQDYRNVLLYGNQLYQELVDPLHLSTKSVIVSTDGFLQPLELLSRSATQEDFLVRHYAFSYAYSANLLLKKSDRQVSARKDFLGLAPVRYHSALNQVTLAGSDDTLKAISRLFNSATVLTGPEAIKSNFLKEFSGYQVIQFLTHADADSLGREPVLYFADAALPLSQLQRTDSLNAELVVLSACKTGIGANQEGEGVFSLARGFAMLGIPSIVTTLWSVQDNATYRITHLFHKYLVDGLPKDKALQQAKLDYLNSASPEEAYPTLWAAYILLGDTDPLILSDSGSSWITVAFVFVIFSSLAGFIFWRRGRRSQSEKASVKQTLAATLVALVRFTGF
ncbi:hypothetical protein GCM10023189_10660 [Nibrella saemangeumensis]|uniref:CHAT domain-containing protein n=1 Tax=Nibrella saemangeumensis TaxID=1084526 RepID=A0ABP8MGZ8_9BACT